MVGEDRAPCPREYTIYHSGNDHQNRRHGGSGLLVRNDLAQRSLSLNTPLEAVAVQISLSRVYTICSLYLPPNRELSRNEITGLVNQLPQPFLLLGDVNARHHHWGDSVSNLRGEYMLSLIDSLDLTILNTGKPTHFHVQTGSFSCIDLSVTSPNAFIDFDWDVSDDLYGSDHFPIILTTGDSIPLPRAPRWCSDQANWLLFQELSHIEADINDLPSVNEAVFYLNSIFIDAGNQSIPKTSGQFHRKPVPWWNIECRIKHKAMRAAFTRYRRRRCAHYLISFKKARARFRRQIKKARRESWILFLSSITWKTPMTLVWTKIKKIAGKFKPSPPPVLKINGTFFSDPKIVSNIFAEHFAKVSSRDPNSVYHDHRLREESHILDFTAHKSESYNLPFSMKEFLAALGSSKNTAPGSDDVIQQNLTKPSPLGEDPRRTGQFAGLAGDSYRK